MLDPAFLQDPAETVLIRVPELARRADRDDLDVPVRVEGPRRARGEGVVVQHPQRAEPSVLRVEVVPEAELPAAEERAVLDHPALEVDVLGLPDRDHQAHGVGRGVSTFAAGSAETVSMLV